MCVTLRVKRVNKEYLPDVISVNAGDEDLALLVHEENGADHGGGLSEGLKKGVGERKKEGYCWWGCCYKCSVVR